ncbi:MAG: TIR domain-containing protein [Candidatus Cloacimonetes bacterium]|nr:TIR domain-containing protein [Candidatus Cloacimonadota bacterium]
MEDRIYRYDAFISYRHTYPDQKWAKWLLKSLETYKISKEMAKRLGIVRDKLRIFRDEDELPTSANLSDSLQQALEASRFLIVICSPKTPKSLWVRQEIIQFRQMRRDDRILALLIEDEPGKSFPTELRELRKTITREDGSKEEIITNVEPLAADVRKSRKESQNFLKRMAKLRILACLYSCKFDDLRQRDAERSKKKKRVIGFISLVSILVLTLLTNLAIQKIKIESRKSKALYLGEQAKLLLNDKSPNVERSVLLSIESLKRYFSIQSENTLRKGMSLLRKQLNKITLNGNYNELNFSQRGNYLASFKGSYLQPQTKPGWCIYNIPNGELISQGETRGWILDDAFSSDEKYYYTLSNNFLQGSSLNVIQLKSGITVSKWNVQNGYLVKKITTKQQLSYYLTKNGRFCAWVRIQEENSENYMYPTILEIYDLDSCKLIFKKEFNHYLLHKVIVSEDGKKVMIIQGDGIDKELSPYYKPRIDIRVKPKIMYYIYKNIKKDHFVKIINVPDKMEIWNEKISDDSASAWLSHNGRFIIIADNKEKNIALYDVENKSEKIISSDNILLNVDFSPDDRFAAIVPQAKAGRTKVEIIELNSKKNVYSIKILGTISKISFDKNENLICISSNRIYDFSPNYQDPRLYSVDIFKIQSGERIAQINKPLAELCPSKSIIATIENEEIQLWDLYQENNLFCGTYKKAISSVNYSLDDNLFTVGSCDINMWSYHLPSRYRYSNGTQIKIFDRKSKKEIAQLKKSGIFSCFCPDSKFLITSSYPYAKGSRNWIWKLDRGNETTCSPQIYNNQFLPEFFRQHSKSYKHRHKETRDVSEWSGVTFSNDSKYVFLQNGDTIKLCESNTGEIINSFEATDLNSSGVLIADPYLFYFAIFNENKVDIWCNPKVNSINNEEELLHKPTKTKHLKYFIKSIFYNSQSDLCAIVCTKDKQTLNFVNPTSILSGNQDINSLIPKKPTEYLQIVKLPSGKVEAIITCPSVIYEVKFNPNGNLIAFITDDGLLRILKSSNGHVVANFQHNEKLFALAFDNNGKYIATGDIEGIIHIWDLNQKEEIVRLKHDVAVLSLAFSYDKQCLLAGYMDGTVKEWYWHPNKLIEIAGTILTRNLSMEEWKIYFGSNPYEKTILSIP